MTNLPDLDAVTERSVWGGDYGPLKKDTFKQSPEQTALQEKNLNALLNKLALPDIIIYTKELLGAPPISWDVNPDNAFPLHIKDRHRFVEEVGGKNPLFIITDTNGEDRAEGAKKDLPDGMALLHRVKDETDYIPEKDRRALGLVQARFSDATVLPVDNLSGPYATERVLSKACGNQQEVNREVDLRSGKVTGIVGSPDAGLFNGECFLVLHPQKEGTESASSISLAAMPDDTTVLYRDLDKEAVCFRADQAEYVQGPKDQLKQLRDATNDRWSEAIDKLREIDKKLGWAMAGTLGGGVGGFVAGLFLPGLHPDVANLAIGILSAYVGGIPGVKFGNMLDSQRTVAYAQKEASERVTRAIAGKPDVRQLVKRDTLTLATPVAQLDISPEKLKSAFNY
jgi:hypothetical protein